MVSNTVDCLKEYASSTEDVFIVQNYQNQQTPGGSNVIHLAAAAAAPAETDALAAVALPDPS